MPEAGVLAADTRIVVVEGNYTLLNRAPWSALRPLFDFTVMVAPPIDVPEARLIQRWLEHGHGHGAAECRARGNDLPNAQTVMEESAAAEMLFG